ncbi:5-methylcytosine restriction system specificity protein McrC [Moraxella osloensis]|uniref:Restriction endonuclease n=1 Tax=Faucicola osloensis TaxID=34062 RepID=A0A2D2LVI9_FAUOS|nr:hypothetical protein [Moraxella osloensis]ATR79049.1 hypothetical protein NP7_07160 [Moraxella osloensis]
MKTIITFEHSYLTAADFNDGQDFDWLIEQNFDVFRIERKQQQWQLKVRHYIGVIGLPSGGQVEILPKLAQAQITHADEVAQTRQWVQQMLTAVWQALLPKSLPNLANQRLINPLAPNPPPINHSLSLSEWLQAYFWQGFAQYVPNQQYQQFEQNQLYLQGKLLIKQQLQHNCHQPHKFYHQSENFVMDTAGNRLVKTTIERVIGSMASSPLSSPLLPQWQAVDIVARDLYDILFSQALQELTALPSLLAQRNYTFISFCYALLTLQQASSQGQFLTPTWLVNMPFAFEKWVGRKIQQQFAAQNFELVEQKRQPLTVQQGLTIKPDIWLKSADKLIIADVKWKKTATFNDISLADMYQLLTYASEFDADEAWLIVPTLSTQLLAQPIEFCQPKKTRFYLIPFAVRQGCLNLFY